MVLRCHALKHLIFSIKKKYLYRNHSHPSLIHAVFAVAGIVCMPVYDELRSRERAQLFCIRYISRTIQHRYIFDVTIYFTVAEWLSI